ncbi:membrane fusion protein, multidrug efflux system [Lebetimonas natsushimae]|uniref:Membrane fusion protein, multidrug efflux system n=1 Tax=Lebetimonas natsushimae TaxID=1936991 RepID=A0A292YAV2_9BACT|nr:HlyD family efflux transporter periplasmic adaptor subunit [Lebetimonas natsushimae]GAX86878.1 membrane fusion protein, multidrug efflux system [Lebetimonas natsushimae]
MKKKIALIVFAVLIGISLFVLVKYIIFSKNYATSNAVFVKTDSLTNLSFKIPGKIEKIYVNEGESVKKGELLAKLNTKDLEIQRKELINQIEALNKKIEASVIQKDKLSKDIDENIDLINVQIKKLSKLIEAKKYAIKAKENKLQKLQNDYKRFSRLYKNKKISIEKFENVKTAFLALQNEINADKKILESMYEDKNALFIKLKLAENNKKEISRLAKLIQSMKSQLEALNDKLALINQHIKDSFIYAPFNGKIAKKFTNANEVVNAGTKILSIVNPKDLYVLVLLEETKLKGIKTGNYVKIHIDTTDKDYEGYVNKILPASAATFALVPRDISSGEFTKLSQRFYIRIKFKKIPDDVLVGMSGEVEIARN